MLRDLFEFTLLRCYGVWVGALPFLMFQAGVSLGVNIGMFSCISYCSIVSCSRLYTYYFGRMYNADRIT
jgi:hypothetical protein